MLTMKVAPIVRAGCFADFLPIVEPKLTLGHGEISTNTRYVPQVSNLLAGWTSSSKVSRVVVQVIIVPVDDHLTVDNLDSGLQ